MKGSTRKTYIQTITEPPRELFSSGYQQRHWLKNHGKQQCISFSDQSLSQLRRYFNSLDQDGSGSIGVEELEEPFIAFGLSENREEIEELIKSVDLDGSGQIEFDEFLNIMLKIKRGKSTGSKNSAMYDFFQKISTGQLGEEFDKDMSFRMNVSNFRRRKLLQSIMSENKEVKEKGFKILQNFKKQIINNPDMKQALNQSKKGTIFTYGLQYKSKNMNKTIK